MITKLPVNLTASDTEPGFSVLARNTDANAVRTTQEFCVATGLNKKKICSGDPVALTSLGRLTGSNMAHLLSNSPHQLHRRNTVLNGKTLLSRSVRKTDLSICPQCWAEIVNTADFRPYHLRMKCEWLLRSIQTCSIHQISLIPLPFNDYSTCYDHVFRSRLDLSWLNKLPSLISPQTPTQYEEAVFDHLNNKGDLCHWLGGVQIDALERWCVGLGFFLERGTGRPDKLSTNTHRQMVDIGFDITARGSSALHQAVDAGLGKHSLRMGKTWLYGWAFQAANPPERRPFRALMKAICDDQGYYCLLSVAHTDRKAPYVEAEIRKIAKKADKPVRWVRNVLLTDGLVPENGIPTQGHLAQHMQICQRHVVKVADGMNAKSSAAHLNIGIKAFEGLVEDHILHPIKTKTSAKPRFERNVIDGLLATIMTNLDKTGPHATSDIASIPEACFAVSCTTAKITNLLISDQLSHSYTVDPNLGFAGIRINILELKSKLLMQATTGLTMPDLREQLGLQYSEVKQLTDLKLLPSFAGRKKGSSRPALIVDPSDLAEFLDRFQTIRTAAARLGLGESAARSKMLNSSIHRATAGLGLPIYLTADIFALERRSGPRRRLQINRADFRSGASPPDGR